MHFIFSKEHKRKEKDKLRQAIWEYMDRAELVSEGGSCRGAIPDFVGAGDAAERLDELEEWKGARVVFSAPDASLVPARAKALFEGKTLLVAAPGMEGFYLIEGVRPEEAAKAASPEGFEKYGRAADVGGEKLPRVDICLTGAVAVDRKGNRLGEGKGYGDREDALLRGSGLVDESTPRVAVVHQNQLLDNFSYITEEGDRKVSVVVTPMGVERVGGAGSVPGDEN